MALAPNTKVRVKNDPSKIGHTTAARKNIGPMQYVQVDYGTTKNYHPESHLEVVLEHENPDVLFKKGAYGAPDTLRMAVILEKLQGQITNMFYSMNVSSADFLPYQFKPVLKFIESISGRILIADEVGLGKTIEAAYIWKELEARKDAKRLLVVCPAVLREKWKHDLHNLFGIRAQIWDAKSLYNEINQAYLDQYSTFVGIVSIEAIRTKYDEDSETPAKTFQDKITKILITQRDRQADFSLFDLVIIDEAHYLRNQNTASNKTATLIRDTAEHLVLLSATPVQTSSRNLFELLRLMAPEDYYDYQAYLGAIEENRPILDAIAAINRANTTYQDIQYHSQQLYHLVDESIRNKMETVYLSGNPTPQERVDISWRLSEYSYLNEYMNRTRKRDVKTRQVVREPHAVAFQLTDFERNVYESISDEIRMQVQRSEKGAPFVLTLRQRHMASCLPMGVLAYLRSIDENEEDYEREYDEENFSSHENADWNISHVEINYDLVERLKKTDSKYQRVSQSIREDVFSYNPHEKIIIFTFFRSTVQYLQERLSNDGYSVCLIKGGMGESKYEILEDFAREDGPNILLSTEVGAEGLDLQFARVMINYDLPWNPMRVEQRIGRIDRIGQKAKKISIFNMVCENTIEDRVLQRLYDRIDIFKGTVGELDEIIGSRVEQLMMQIINEDLTDDQAMRKVEQEALAIENNRRDQETLEEQAINLLGFNDFIMQSIYDAMDRDRFIASSDLLSFVDDYFFNHYPGSKVKERYRDEDVVRVIRLSEDARMDLARFINKNPSPTKTRLASQSTPVICVFDPQYTASWVKNIFHETIELKHPLIQWILSEYEKEPQAIYRCAAVAIPHTQTDVPPGQYAFVIQRWVSQGSVDRRELKYFAKPISGFPELNERQQEMLIKATLNQGNKWHESSIDVDRNRAIACFEQLSETIQEAFFEHMEGVRVDNEIRKQKQIRYAKSMRDREMASAQARLDGLIATGKSESVIRATKGRLNKIEERYRSQLRRVEMNHFDPMFDDVAVGIIKVEE